MPKKQANKQAIITIRQQWCKGCGICASFCPKSVYKQDSSGHPIVVNQNNCILCMLCVERCPDFAIDVEDACKVKNNATIS